MTRLATIGLILLLSTTLTAGCGRPPDAEAPASVASTHQGATAIEYGLIAARIAVVIIGALVELGESLEDTFGAVSDAVGETTDASKRGVPAACPDRCRRTLDSSVARCESPPCVDAAAAAYIQCVRTCRGRGAPAGALPLVALQYTEAPSLSLPDDNELPRAERFVVPSQVSVRYGDPGTGTALVAWRTPRGVDERCTYTADVDRYVFDSCTDGSTPGGTMDADRVSLTISAGALGPPVTSAAVNLERP